LKLIKEALARLERGLTPGNSGIAMDLGGKLSGIADRLDKIEKKLGISN
jgi:hypothetical protein